MPMITLDGGSLSAYRADAGGDELRGALVLVHEIWGLVPHITEVAERFAAEGYLVVAPDLLSGIGVDPETGSELERLMSNLDEAERSKAQPLFRERLAPLRSPQFAEFAISALKKVIDYLEEQPGVSGRIGVIGFCFGGTYSFALAAADQRIRSAVPFYGEPPEGADLAVIQCPILAFYGDQDERLMASLPKVVSSMHDAGVSFEEKTYVGAGHAFFNDGNRGTYDRTAAEDAWFRTIDFLRGTLASSAAS